MTTDITQQVRFGFAYTAAERNDALTGCGFPSSPLWLSLLHRCSNHPDDAASGQSSYGSALLGRAWLCDFCLTEESRGDEEADRWLKRQLYR